MSPPQVTLLFIALGLGVSTLVAIHDLIADNTHRIAAAFTALRQSAVRHARLALATVRKAIKAQA